MDIRELEDFKLSDAVKFHDELNPALWVDDKLRPEVKDQLIKIADDFLAELGISGLKVKDITVSGSNAAYTYTPYSDLDLHLLVDFNDLSDDEVYQELFTAKKSLYNDSHDIKVHGVPVELYVQDSNKPVVSVGEYSLKSNDWLKFPSKRKANFNQSATRAKYEKLGSMIELALQSDDIDQIDKVTKIIKQYRQAGLDKHGEFGPENLAYKALRNMGMIKKLYDHKNKIHSKELSIEGAMDEDWHPNDTPPGPEFKPTMPKGTIRVDVSDVYDWYKLGQHISNMKGLGKHDFGQGPPSTILSFGDEDLEHKYIDALNKTGLDTTDIDPKAHDIKKGQKVDPTYNVNEILNTKSKNPFYQIGGGFVTDKAVPFKTKSGNFYEIEFINALDAYSGPRLRQFPKIKPKLIPYKDEIVDNGVEVVFRQDDYRLKNPAGITGAGSAAEVFGIVTNKILEYIKKFNPPYLYFTSYDDEPSRVKLYNSLLKRVVPAMSGYFYKAIKIEKGYQFVILDSDFFVNNTINEILDKDSAAKVYWSKNNYMTGGKVSQHFTLHTAAAQDKNKNLLKYNFYDFPKYKLIAVEFSRAVGPWGDNFSIDNAGDQYTVFATLIQTMKEYIGKHNPKYIMFGAKEPSRAKLYQTFVNRFASKFGYKQISPDSIPKPVSSMILNSGDTPFLLQKVEKKEQGVAEGGAETSWSDGDEKITLQDILELTKHIKQINLPINDNLKSKLIHWDGNPEEIERINQVTVSNQFPILVMLDGQGQIDWILDGNHRLHKAIKSQAKTIPAKLIKPSDLSDKARKVFHIKEASGYIPSEREKNDPRFKTALTVDVKPDSIKKNARAFGFKVSRAGIPPLLRK